MSTKVKLKTDNNIDWTNTEKEPFPFTTASNSFHQDWKKTDYVETMFDDFAKNFVSSELRTEKNI